MVDGRIPSRARARAAFSGPAERAAAVAGVLPVAERGALRQRCARAASLAMPSTIERHLSPRNGARPRRPAGRRAAQKPPRAASERSACYGRRPSCSTSGAESSRTWSQGGAAARRRRARSRRRRERTRAWRRRLEPEREAPPRARARRRRRGARTSPRAEDEAPRRHDERRVAAEIANEISGPSPAGRRQSATRTSAIGGGRALRQRTNDESSAAVAAACGGVAETSRRSPRRRARAGAGYAAHVPTTASRPVDRGRAASIPRRCARRLSSAAVPGGAPPIVVAEDDPPPRRAGCELRVVAAVGSAAMERLRTRRGAVTPSGGRSRRRGVRRARRSKDHGTSTRIAASPSARRAVERASSSRRPP